MSDNYTGDFKTLSDTYVAPKARVSDYISASTIVQDVIQNAGERNRKGAMVKGMFDGNKPYSDAKLRAKGMAYYPNFSSMEGKSYLSNAMVPYYDLVSGGNALIEVSLDVPDLEIQATWSRIVSEELERAMRIGPWFENNIWKMAYDFVGFGKGYFMWPDTVDWRFRQLPWYRVYFPDCTDVDPDKWDHLVFEWQYTVHDLYNRVREPGRAKAAGWDRDGVMKSIRNACGDKARLETDWIKFQQQLKDHDLASSTQADMVYTAWLIVKEFTGKWSILIVPRSGQGSSGNLGSDYGLLYTKVGQYDDIHSLLASFFFEVTDGSLNGLSGLGKDIYTAMVVKDKMNCAKAHNVFLRSSVILQAQNGSGRQKAAAAQIGNVTLLPEGYAVQPSTILGDIQSAIEVGQDFDRMLQSNTGIYKPAFEKPSGNPEPFKTVELRFQQGTVISNSAVNRFYVQLDRCYEEMYRRIVKSSDKDAKKFRQWCMQRGVPESVLGKTRSVRAYRNMGNGNPFLRQSALSGLAQMFQEYPEPGKQNFVEDWVASFGNQFKVDRYMPQSARANIPTRHVWEAMQENGNMKESAPVTWTPDQEDETHLGVHGNAVAQSLQGVSQGADPNATLVFCQNVLAHAVSHIQSLARKQRKASLKQWEATYKDLAKQVNQLAQLVHQSMSQQQQLQQKMQQQLTDTQVKAQASQARIQLQAQKQQAQMQLKGAQAAQDMKIKEAQATQDLRLKGLKMEQELNIKAGHARIGAAGALQEQQIKMASAQADANAPAGSTQSVSSAPAKKQSAAVDVNVNVNHEKPKEPESPKKPKKMKFSDNADGSVTAEEIP